MTDYIISNSIDGGARIKVYRSTLIDRPPEKTFDITKEKFESLEKLISELRQQAGEP
jgi:hypothetical protein